MPNDLHAPTLRRVIEMLEREIAGAQRRESAWLQAARDADDASSIATYLREHYKAYGRSCGLRMAVRLCRERLEREAEKAGG